MFPCLFRQGFGKLQPVGQTRAPPVFVKVLLEQVCAHLLTCCPWRCHTGGPGVAHKAGKIYHLSL